MKEVKERIMKFVFLLTACVSILAVALICIFMFTKGIPAIAKIGPGEFCWDKSGNRCRIFLEFCL